MSDYPWHVRDQIESAIRGKVDRHEMAALAEHLDRMERALLEARATIDGLRAQVESLSHSLDFLARLPS